MRSGEAIASFLERRGQRVVEAMGVFWSPYLGPLWISLPNQLHLDFDPREVVSTLSRSGCAGARYPSLTRPGVPAGLYVCRNKDYDMRSLQPRVRTYVRRALAEVEVRIVTPDELERQGFQCNLDTQKRHGRFDPEFGRWSGWKKFIAALRQTPEAEAVGGFVDGELASYAVSVRDGAWRHILIRNSREDLNRFRAPHAVLYTMLREAMADPTVEAVDDSPVPMVPDGGLHDWKLRLGYEVKRQNIVWALHPALKLALVNPVSCSMIRFMGRFRKTETLARRLELIAGAAAESSGPDRSVERQPIHRFWWPGEPARVPAAGQGACPTGSKEECS